MQRLKSRLYRSSDIAALTQSSLTAEDRDSGRLRDGSDDSMIVLIDGGLGLTGTSKSIGMCLLCCRFIPEGTS